jgi:hypothetical protein
MTRRTSLSPTQQVDLVQRRRTREAGMYSEQPVPLDVLRLPGTGEGSGFVGIANYSWLSPDIGWMDPEAGWLA